MNSYKLYWNEVFFNNIYNEITSVFPNIVPRVTFMMLPYKWYKNYYFRLKTYAIVGATVNKWPTKEGGLKVNTQNDEILNKENI